MRLCRIQRQHQSSNKRGILELLSYLQASGDSANEQEWVCICIDAGIKRVENGQLIKIPLPVTKSAPEPEPKKSDITVMRSLPVGDRLTIDNSDNVFFL